MIDIREHCPARASLFITLTCFLVNVIEGYDVGALGAAAPTIAPALGFKADQMGLVFGAVGLGMLVGSPLCGGLADRHGRRRTLVATLFVLCISTLSTSLVRSFHAFLVLRLLTGLALGGVLPCVIALASEAAPLERRNAVLTSMFAGFPVGGVAAAVTALVLLPRLGWPTVFVIGGIVPIAVIPLVLLALPETRRAVRRTLSFDVFAELFHGTLRTATPLLCVACAITLLIFYLLINWLPLLFVIKGMSPRIAPLASLMFSGGNFVAAPAIGLLVDRYGFRRPTVIVYCLLAVALFGLASVGGLPSILLFALVAGALVTSAQLSLYGLAPLYYPMEVRGVGVGVVVGFGRVGGLIGPLAAGYLLTRNSGESRLLEFLVPCILLAALAVVVLPVAQDLPRSS